MDENLTKTYEKYQENEMNQFKSLQYAKSLVRQTEYDKALKILSEITEEKIQNEVEFYTAIIYKYQRRLDDAEQLFNNLLNTNYRGRCMYELAQMNIEKLKYLKKNKSDNVNDLKEKIVSQLTTSISEKPTFKAYLSLANHYYYEKDYLKAIEIYLKTLKNDENNIHDNYYIKVKLVESYIFINEIEKAKEILNNLINSNYKNPININRLYTKIYIKQNNYESAKESITKLDSQAFEVYFEYAKLCMSKRYYEEAEIYFTKCLNGFNKSQSLHQLAKINFSLGKINKAKNLYTELLCGNKLDQNIGYIGIGMCERLLGNYSLSLENFEKVDINNIREKVQVYIEKGKVYKLMGNLEEAEKYFKSAMDLNYNGFGKLEYARFKISLFESEEARKILTELINTNASDKDMAMIVLGKLELMEKNTEFGLNILKNIPKSSETYYEAIVELLKYYIETDNLETVEHYLGILGESKKNVDKSNYDYYNGILEYKKNNLDLAIVYLKKCLNGIKKEKALYEIANIYLEDKSDVETAMKYINLLKDSSVLGESLSKYLLGKMYLKNKEEEKGISYLKEVTSKSLTQNIEAIQLLAEYEEEKENYEKAIEYYYMLPEKYCFNNFNFKIVDLYQKSKRYEDAKVLINKIIDSSDEKNNYALFKLGTIEYLLENYDKSLEILNSLKNTELEEYALLQISKIYNKLNEPEKCDKILKDLLNTSNRNYALMELIVLNFNNMRFKESLEYIEKLLENGSRTDILMSNYYKSKIYFKTGNKNQAKKILQEMLFDEDNNRKASLTESEYNKFLLELAHVERDLGNIYKAEEYYKSVKLSNKNWPFAIRELIELKLNKRNFEEATKLIKLLEENSYEYIANISKAQLLMSSGQFEEALTQFDRITPFSDEIKYNKAICYLNMGEFSKAQEIFLVLYDSQEYKELVSYHLGVLSKNNNNNFEARKYFGETCEYNMNALLNMIMIDIEEEKYIDALSKLNVLYQSDSYQDKCTIIYMMLSKKLNIIFDEECYGYDNYTKRQILEYSEESAKNHVKKHFRENNAKKRDGTFNENIDIDFLFEYVKAFLNKDNLIVKDFMDTYIIPFENVGENGESYLRIVTFPGTKDIITMYPCFEKYKDLAEETRRI